jgi:protein involved in polysaccharide export with SLBB domain
MRHPGPLRLLLYGSCGILFLSLLLIPSNGPLSAQQISSGQTPAEIYQALTPEQRQAMERLTPEQKQALKAELIKSGGKVTPEMIEQVKARLAGDQTSEQATQTGEQAVAQPQPALTPEELREIRAAAEKEEKKFEERTGEDLKDAKGETVQRLRRFGLDLFAPSRKRVLFLEEALSRGEVPAALQKDALSGFIGPLDMVSSIVNASAPPQYVLSPNDRITVYYWGDLIELTTLNLALDDKGEVSVPRAGRFVARGMSLPQLQKAVQDQLARAFGKDIKLMASMDKLNSIQISIIGDAFRPGSYAVSAVTTLFNALFAAGGPNAQGSLRDVKLIRRNTTTTVDFYDYLLHGDGRSDAPLQAGDAIFIGRAGRLVSMAGEVNRQAVFELKKNETLKDLVAMAGGIKPTGLNNRVHVKSVVPNREKTVVDVDLSAKGAADYALYDGDSVSVGEIVQVVMNYVTLEGNVKVPGVYELKKNMRVADLFNDVNQPWGEAYLDRADIFRLDKDRKTTTIVPVNLGKALQKDPAHNIELTLWDRIVVYSKWDVKYYPEMVVTISGSVQKPGEYVRAVGMKLRDLLDLAGGTLPGTSNDIVIAKARSFGEIRTIQVKLDLLEKGDESQNVPLDDMDIVMVREDSEFFERPRWVKIGGEVKYPGTYPLLRKDYRLSELISRAGGLTRTANPKGAVFLRKREFLPSTEQTSDLAVVNKVVNALNDSEAKRQAARNMLLLQMEAGLELTGKGPAIAPAGGTTVVASGTSTKEAAALAMAPSIAQAAGTLTGGLVSAFTPGAAMSSQARTLPEEQLTQSTRVIIDLEKAMQGGENQENTILMSNDTITIPQQTETVSVVGAVMNPVTIHLGSHRKVRDLISYSGGYAADADKERALVLRVDGSLQLAEDLHAVEEGDIIYVPTKVVATDIITTADKVINVIKYTLATAAGVIVFLALVP